MRRTQRGFTLIELMIVITVMGLMAAMIAPGLGEFTADNRAATAAEDLVRLTRHVGARAHQSGLAHLLVYTSDTKVSGGLGRILVYEGMNNHCRLTPWSQAITGTVKEGHIPVESMDMGDPHYNQPVGGAAPTVDSRDRQLISLLVSGPPGAPDVAVLCFEPSGAMWQGVLDAGIETGFTFTRPTAPVKFTVSRRLNGVVRGRPRELYIQTNGIARFKY
jgi:prepilin-type N-terminal cleavage/methylation domain-containing protein